MKKWISILLTLALLLGLSAATAEATEAGGAISLRVGTTTPFSGNFFSAALGNNASDLDVRGLIYDYSPVSWNGTEGIYHFDERVVDGAMTTVTGSRFILALHRGLTYSDGSPITARDYAFSLLLSLSHELQEAAGRRADGSMIKGFDAYDRGETKGLAGLRILGEYQLELTINEEYLPYFYELKILDIIPYPAEVIAPGCRAADDGNGAYIEGNFTADLLKTHLLDPETGYMSHPSVTTGPYMLTAYDGEQVTLELNPYHVGDAEGNKPYIDQLLIRVVDSNALIRQLAQGELDLVVRCLRNDQIVAGMQLAASGDFAMSSYVRNGLGFISFCAEKGPTASQAVRQAISLCMDKDGLVNAYSGGYGIRVDGYYGIGQWMYMMANGTLIPEEGDEDAEAWANLSLEGLSLYPLDPAGAADLFALDGWTLNERGSKYNEEIGGVRYREENGELIPLKLKLIYPQGNELGDVLPTVFGNYLEQAGASLEMEALPMPELLERYYGLRERDCDMILLGTNFPDVFDPSTDFDENGTDRLNGITDGQLAELARDLRKTEPGKIVQYTQKWLAFQEYRTRVVPEIPLYSNAYFDFHIASLRDYAPAAGSSWAKAILSARISDFEPEAEEEESFEGEEFFID